MVDMKKRTISALVLLVILISSLIVSSKVFAFVMAICAVIGFNEFFNINISRYRIAEKLKADNVWDSCVTDMMDTCFDDLIDNLDVGDDELFREEFF